MLIVDIIDPWWFLISFCVGIFVVYCMYNTPDVYIKYPTPDNAKDNIFRDDTDNCYRFKTTEVDCPKNPLSIHTIPVQRKVEYFDDHFETHPMINMTRDGVRDVSSFPFEY